MQNNGIIKNPIIVDKKEKNKYILKKGCKNECEYQNKCAQEKGYINDAERQRERSWNKGICPPLSESKETNWKFYFGIITQNRVIEIYEDEDPISMSPNNPGFDWIFRKTMNNIQHKARILDYDNKSTWSGWKYPINFNRIPDEFILTAWIIDNGILIPKYIWRFKKNDIIRGTEFWKRGHFDITNRYGKLLEFKRYEESDKLEILKSKIKISPIELDDD